MPQRSLSTVLATTVIAVAVSSCGGNGAEQPAAEASSASPAASASPGSPTDPSPSSAGTSSMAGDTSGDDVVAQPPKKTWADAVAAARQDFDGKVSKIELERKESGGLEYKIELLSPDTKFAVQYDADSLTQLSAKREALGDDAAKKQQQTFDPDALISLDKAASTARQRQDGTITTWKIEGKDTGLVLYEFDIAPRGASQDKEVQINAKDGSVIKAS